MKLSNITWLSVKELRSLWHDRILLLLIIWAFSGGIYAMAKSTSVSVSHAPIAIVDQDHSQLSGRFFGLFTPPWFKPPVSLEEDEIDLQLDRGNYTFVLVIPHRFEADLRAGRQPELQLIIDATRMSQAFLGSSYIQQIIQQELMETLYGRADTTSLPIQLQTRVWFNPNLESSWFGSVMEIINNITLLSIILTGAALIREREHGTLEHLMVMPLTPAEIMLSKLLSNACAVLLGAGLSVFLVVQGLLEVPIRGSIPLFLCGAAVHLFAAGSIGIFLGTLARSMPQFGLLLILTILPLQLLSGGITPRESMPEAVQQFMLLAPTTHFVSLAQAILYRGAGLNVVWPALLATGTIGLAFFGLTLSLFRRSLAREH